MTPTRDVRRSRAVPLSLVPILAAAISTACAHSPTYDPCEPDTYQQAACDAAVANHGYFYNGTWYPHVYSYAPFWYLNRYNGFIVGGGRVRSLSPTVYAPSAASPARTGVVRGGFGGIGEGHAFAGS